MPIAPRCALFSLSALVAARPVGWHGEEPRAVEIRVTGDNYDSSPKSLRRYTTNLDHDRDQEGRLGTRH